MTFKSVLLCALLCALSFSALLGQGYGRMHPHDFRDFNFGFIMGLSYNQYNLKKQVNVWERGILLRRIELQPQPGINLGMISSLKLNNQVSLRFTPSVSLELRNFNYVFADRRGNDSIAIRRVDPAYFNLPLLLQFKTPFYDAYRFYLLAGPQIGFNRNMLRRVQDDPDLLKIQTQDLSFVVGAGMTLYGDRLKLSPELRYSIGLRNLYVPENTSFASAISLLLSQVLTFNVNFE